jgi:hypothetical protein
MSSLSEQGTQSLYDSEDSEPDLIDETDNDTVANTASSRHTTQSHLSASSMNGDNLPKSFLQLKGISVGNYNMGCHFHISAAIHLLVQYNLQILAT